MAKKSDVEKKRTSVKKEKKEEKHYDFPDYVKTVVRERIVSEIENIRKICLEYQGIVEMPDSEWEKLREIVLDVQDKVDNRKHKIEKPVKRKKYTITERVWEMDRKKFLLNWCDRYDAYVRDKDDKGIIYAAYLIFLHLEIMIKETMVIKKKSEEKKKKSEEVSD